MAGHDVNADSTNAARVTQLSSHRRADRGASLVEYALLISLIAVVCLGALRQFGLDNGGSINQSADRVVNARTYTP